MSRQDCILFDFDGTLADTLKVNHQIMNELSVKYKFKYLSETEVKQLKMLPAKQVLKYMAIVPYKVPFVMAGAKRRLQQRIDEIQMLPGFADLLQSLSTRYQLGVVTSNAQKNVSRFLRDHDAAVIDFIYADTRLSGKARVLKKVLKKECLQPTRTLYIGDEIRDIKAAKVAGIAVIAVTWGYNTREVLVQHHPDHVVDTLEQLDTAIQAVFI